MEKEIHTIDPLFDFQILCDTDIGLYNLIKRDYYDKSVFNNHIFDSDNIDFIKTKLMCRELFNPLHIFCKKGIITNEELDDLYNEFLEKEYENIINLSPPTAVFQLASMANSIKNAVRPVVLCKNKIEVDWLQQYDNKLKYIIEQYKNFSLKMYDTLYIKDIYTLLLFNQETIDEKNIIIGKYIFNMEIATTNIELPILEVAKRYYIKNKFMIIDIYKGIGIPIIEKEN